MSKIHVKTLLNDYQDINVAAPMVRYSKLPFRELVSKYNTHVTYTPMMIAREFSRSAKSRDADFSTNSLERGIHRVKSKHGNSYYDDIEGVLVAQFGSSDPTYFADATEIISPYVDGVDLNCGCPQRWAIQEGIGSALLRNPENVRDHVRMAKDRVGWNFPILVKIRVDPDLQRTEQLVSTAIAAGCDVITIHGRTRHDPSDSVPVKLDDLAFAASCTKNQVPTVGNGDIFHLNDAIAMRTKCNVNGVMSARGLLCNPALYAGYDTTPRETVDEFIKICIRNSLPYSLFHRHVAYMSEALFENRIQRSFFNSISSYAGVIDFCREELGCPVKM